jgi:hypothetical protein
MKEEPQISLYPYEEIIEAISKMQGERCALVILEDPDGGITHLGHHLSKESLPKFLRQAALILESEA